MCEVKEKNKRVELLALNTVLTASIVLLFLIMPGHSADRRKVHCDAQSGLHISFPLSLLSNVSILNQKSGG